MSWWYEDGLTILDYSKDKGWHYRPIKETKMEFDKSRCYSALNADELRAGDKVITARCMADLKTWVEADAEPNIIERIQDETNTDRFTCKHYGSNKTYDSPLAYLVERKKNCTNCGSTCGYADENHHTLQCSRCDNWQPKAEPKTEKAPAWFVKGLMDGSIERTSDETEKHTDYNHCEEAVKATNACPNKHYRPFRDINELINVWKEKSKQVHSDYSLTMPHIWVRSKFNKDHKGVLINNYFGEYVELGTVQCFLERLFGEYTFLDGSPCGVEE